MRQDEVRVNAGTVKLPNIPSGSTTRVLVWDPSNGAVGQRDASSLIGAAGGWAVGGNAFGGTNSTQVLGTTTSDGLQIQTGGANTILFNTNANAGRGYGRDALDLQRAVGVLHHGYSGIPH
jgi:hypothetical protein